MRSLTSHALVTNHRTAARTTEEIATSWTMSLSSETARSTAFHRLLPLKERLISLQRGVWLCPGRMAFEDRPMRARQTHLLGRKTVSWMTSTEAGPRPKAPHPSVAARRSHFRATSVLPLNLTRRLNTLIEIGTSLTIDRIVWSRTLRNLLGASGMKGEPNHLTCYHAIRLMPLATATSPAVTLLHTPPSLIKHHPPLSPMVVIDLHGETVASQELEGMVTCHLPCRRRRRWTDQHGAEM